MKFRTLFLGTIATSLSTLLGTSCSQNQQAQFASKPKHSASSSAERESLELVTNQMASQALTASIACASPVNKVIATPSNFVSIMNAAQSGQTLVFQAGVYSVASQITLRSGVTYCGYGATFTRAPAQGFALFAPSGTANVRIEGFTFDGGGIFSDQKNNGFTIRGNRFQNLSGAYPVDYAIFAPVGFSNTQVMDNVFRAMPEGEGYISWGSQDRVKISNNVFEDIREGIHVADNSSGGSGLEISNNTLRRVARIAIELQGHASDVLVASNRVESWILNPGEPTQFQNCHMALSVAIGEGKNITIRDNVLLGVDISDVGKWCTTGIEVMGNPSLVQHNFAARFSWAQLSGSPNWQSLNNTWVQCGTSIGYDPMGAQAGFPSGQYWPPSLNSGNKVLSTWDGTVPAEFSGAGASLDGTQPQPSSQSSSSSSVTANPADPQSYPPTAPKTLAGVALSSSSIQLTWKDETDRENGFKIERKPAAGAQAFAVVASLGVNAIQYVDSALSPNTEYTYRVTAFNRAGDSTYTNEVIVRTQALSPSPTIAPTITDPQSYPPTAPKTLAGVALSSSSIQLTWKDETDRENGFKIERKPTRTTQAFAAVASVAPNVTQFTDTGLNANWEYTYRVTAFNRAGDSAYTNEVIVQALSGVTAISTPTPTLTPNPTAPSASAPTLPSTSACSSPVNPVVAAPSNLTSVINAARSGQTVVFQAGQTYNLRSRLELKSGVTYCGKGATLKRAPGQEFAFRAGTVSGVRIEGFVFDGAGIFVDTGSRERVFIHGNRFQNMTGSYPFNSAIFAPSGLDNSLITRNSFYNLMSGGACGVLSWGKWNNSRIEDNTFDLVYEAVHIYPGGPGYAGFGGSGVSVSYNTLTRIARYGIELQGGLSDLQVVGNRISNWVTNPDPSGDNHMALSIATSEGTNIVIRDNVLLGNGNFPSSPNTWFAAIEVSGAPLRAEHNFMANWGYGFLDSSKGWVSIDNVFAKVGRTIALDAGVVPSQDLGSRVSAAWDGRVPAEFASAGVRP